MNPQERRERILRAASEAFSEKPYGEVTIGSIALAAGASEALVYQYFSGKAELYTEVVRGVIAELQARHDAAQAALGENTPARDRVRAWITVWLEDLARRPHGWAAMATPGSMEPREVADLRADAREHEVTRLREFLLPNQGDRATYALQGFTGFLESAWSFCARNGCPEDQRWPMIEAALGALEGALGDWGR
jgi:AcrR family transcriptional regulator